MRIALCVAAMVLMVLSGSACSSSSSAQNGLVVESPLVGLSVIGLTPLDSERTIFFAATASSGGFDPWITDGTFDGTALIKEVGSVPGATALFQPFSGQGILIVDGRAYFLVTDDTDRLCLWSSDGTEAGTVLESVLLPAPTNFQIGSLTANGSNLLISGTNYDSAYVAYLFSVFVGG